MLELMQIRFNYLCRAGRENKAGKNPIVLRITYRNERRDLYTGLYCDTADWDTNMSKAAKGKTASTINQNLDLIYRKAHHCFDQLKFSGLPFSLDDLINKIKGKEEKPSLLLEYLQQRKDEIRERRKK